MKGLNEMPATKFESLHPSLHESLNRAFTRRWASACFYYIQESRDILAKAAARLGCSISPGHDESPETYLPRALSSEECQCLSRIARAAEGDLPWEDRGVVLRSLEVLQNQMFSFPDGDKRSDVHHPVPSWWWSTPIGSMFALATVWAKQNELITIKEAARVSGVPLGTMVSRVRREQVVSYPDPDATNPHKNARLVLSSSIDLGKSQGRKH